MAQCQATSKRTGERCGAQAVTGRRVCRHHGGKTPSGVASPNWKHGRHSRAMPTRLLEAAAESLSDPRRLVLDHEIALLDARTNDLLGRVDSGESGALWHQLGQTWRDYEAARRQRDPVAMMAALNTLGELITRGHTDTAAWSEVVGLIERRRKLVDSERRRIQAEQENISREEALAVLARMTEAFHRVVKDEGALREIAREFEHLTGLQYAAGRTGGFDA